VVAQKRGFKNWWLGRFGLVAPEFLFGRGPLRQTRCTTGSCGASQKKGWRKSAHLTSAGKKSPLTMMKQNRKGLGLHNFERGKEQKEQEQKQDTSRTEHMIQVMMEERQHQNDSE